LNRFQNPRGEFVVVIPAADSDGNKQEVPSDQQITAYFSRMENFGLSTKRDAIRQVANHFKMPPRSVYAALERAKKKRTMSGT
jgi:hypothetical protein